MKRKIAIVFGTAPHLFDLQQFSILEADYDITFISSSTTCELISTSLGESKITVLSLPNYEQSPSFLPGLENVIQHFETVIVNDRTGVCAYQLVKAKASCHFRLIVWVDSIVPFPGESSEETRVIRKEICKAADAFLVQSDATRNVLLFEGENPDKIIQVAPQLSPVEFQGGGRNRAQALEDIGLCDGDVVVSYFGPTTWASGLLDLFHAVKLLKDSDAYLGRRLRVVVYGEGNFSRELQERAVLLGFDNDISFLSPRKFHWTNVLRVSAAIFYAPKETIDSYVIHPSVLVRAMIQKVPVISFRAPVIDEYLGKHRLDFCRGSIQSLASALRKLTQARPLIQDIVSKNSNKAGGFLIAATAVEKFKILLEGRGVSQSLAEQAIDSQIAEAEKLAASKQYLEAVNLIEKIFDNRDLTRYQKANLYRLMGDSFTRLNEFERAKDAYIQAIEIDEYVFKAFIGLGTVHMLTKKFEIAIIHFQKAVSLSPNDVMASLGLGLAFQSLGELKEAIKWIYQACRLNPEDLTAIYSLIKIAYELGNFTEAEEVLRRYLAIHPRNYNLLYSLGGVLLKQGKFAETLEVAESILNANPLDQRSLNLHKVAKNELTKGQQAQASLA